MMLHSLRGLAGILRTRDHDVGAPCGRSYGDASGRVSFRDHASPTKPQVADRGHARGVAGHELGGFERCDLTRVYFDPAVNESRGAVIPIETAALIAMQLGLHVAGLSDAES